LGAGDSVEDIPLTGSVTPSPSDLLATEWPWGQVGGSLLVPRTDMITGQSLGELSLESKLTCE